MWPYLFSLVNRKELILPLVSFGVSMIFVILACLGTTSTNVSSTENPQVLSEPPKMEPIQAGTPTTSAPTKPMVILDGVQLEADWDDGDTFSAKQPETQEKISARLFGFNTLESYGPVHQWGEWTEQELYTIAKEAGVFARSKTWTCTDTKNGGGYGRKLVDCPDLRKEMLESGYAHPFSIGNAAPQEDMDAMQKGIMEKKGMWAKGAPKFLITSLHSQEEKPDKEVYNRVCDLSNGQCEEKGHNTTYSVCEKVCFEDSCMTYVPFAQRYRNKAECLLK